MHNARPDPIVVNHLSPSLCNDYFQTDNGVIEVKWYNAPENSILSGLDIIHSPCESRHKITRIRLKEYDQMRRQAPHAQCKT